MSNNTPKSRAVAIGRAAMSSFRPMFHFDGGEVTGNSLRFATRAEAEANAYDKFQLWTMPHGWSVVETNDPVSHAYIDGRVSPIDNPEGEAE